MKIRFISVTSAAIAIGVGFVVLLGYFIHVELLRNVRWLLVSWASTTAAVAVWIGVLNLISVHWKKFNSQSPGWPYSIFLILSMLAVIGAGLVAAPILKLSGGASNAINVWIFRYVQSAAGAALSGLIVFFLVLAGYRLMRRPPSLTVIVFLIVAVISLLGMAPLPAGVPDVGLREVWLWIAQVPAVAGARGILLGVGLGIVATGLRILLALDRPYGE